MKIDQNTRISEILKKNPAAIDAIASINKHFLKLKNPILRKIVASRVNVKDAARIGNVLPVQILQKLSEIGMDVDLGKNDTLEDMPGLVFESDPVKMNTMDSNTIILDVRPILENGVDPFNHIMDHVKKLVIGQKMLVINSFEPVPLISMLKERGFSFETTRPALGEVHTLFYRQDAEVSEDVITGKVYENVETLFDEKLKSYDAHLNVTDVRDMEMPLPMVTILQEIEKLGPANALLVEHKKFPQFLLRELTERGFSMVSKNVHEQHTRLIIFRE